MSDRPMQAVAGFRLVTQDLPRLTRFYHEVLGFAVQGPTAPIDDAEMTLLGVSGRGRRQVLSIGRQIVAIDEFETPGRPYPADSDAASLWFQHLALVVVDIAAAYAGLRDIVPITEGGPQHLPPASGGAHAFKFRDPDGHPLELLRFSQDGVPAAWQDRSPLPGQLALGIDHSAISVGDPDVSIAFYTGLGLQPGTQTHNRGTAQQHLDGLRDVEVEVQPMIPAVGTPHLELLGYRVSRGQDGPALQPNDVAATRVVWQGAKAALLHDPDGHLHQIEA